MAPQFVLDGRPVSASGFLFDKDGTLLSFDHWLDVMRERARRLTGDLGLTEDEQAGLLKFFGLDQAGGRAGDWGIIPLPRCDAEEATAAYLAAHRGGDLRLMRELTARVFREVDEEFPFERHLRPTLGAEATLQAIRRGGGKVAIVTHDTEDAAWRHLAALGWEKFVDVVVGLDGCAARKPSPEPVLAACRSLGVAPADAVMVGDTPTDLQAGRSAGCSLGVGVLTGLGTAEELAPLADLVVPHLAALQVRSRGGG